MTGPVLAARGLSRWYGPVIGLNDVTVEVPPGITGLLGPNGAGKSSFLRMAAGEIRPSAGSIQVLGLSPFANSRLFTRIGYAPEGDRFFDDTRCLDFVAFLLRLSGTKKAAARDRAYAALEELGMEGSAGSRLAAMSKGMRQRVKLAQAIAHGPELLILDEPLAGLDPVARHHVRSLLLEKARQGVSVLVSSHVLSEVESLTRNVLLVHRGRIAAVGEIEEIRGVIDRQPVRIRIESEEPRRLAGFLVDRPEVRSIRFQDGEVLVETEKPVWLYENLPDLVLRHDLAVTGISSPDDHLEAVFDLLVGGGA